MTSHLSHPSCTASSLARWRMLLLTRTDRPASSENSSFTSSQTTNARPLSCKEILRKLMGLNSVTSRSNSLRTLLKTKDESIVKRSPVTEFLLTTTARRFYSKTHHQHQKTPNALTVRGWSRWPNLSLAWSGAKVVAARGTSSWYAMIARLNQTTMKAELLLCPCTRGWPSRRPAATSYSWSRKT